MLCPKCNKDIDDSSEFCPSCGKNLKKSKKKFSFNFFKKAEPPESEVATIVNTDKRKSILLTISIVSVISILICVIVGLASSKSIAWSLFVCGGIVLAWICVIPFVYLKKRRFLFSFLSFTVFVIPVMFIIESISPFKGWFNALALPIAIVALLCLWVIYSLFAFIKLDKFFAGSISVIFLLIMDTVITMIICNALEKSFSVINFIVNFFAFLGISFLLFYLGKRKK